MAMEFLRRQLSGGAALPELSVLAVAVGLVTGTVVLLFRGAIEAVGLADPRPERGRSTRRSASRLACSCRLPARCC